VFAQLVTWGQIVKLNAAQNGKYCQAPHYTKKPFTLLQAIKYSDHITIYIFNDYLPKMFPFIKLGVTEIILLQT